MIISIKGNWIHAEKRHTAYLSGIVKKFLSSKRLVSPGEKEAWEFIDDVYPYLILCQQDDILKSIQLYRAYLLAFRRDKVSKAAFKARIKKVFNYNSFVKKTGSWNAYTLCEQSLARTCPYCNQAYAFTLVVKGRGVRPTLDHYFSKDDFPHLALVLNNLVPSCYSCNSGLKLKRDFRRVPHLHPLWDEENLVFNLNHKNGVTNLYQDLKSDREGGKVELSCVSPCKRSLASSETFLLAERYNALKGEAVDFALSKLAFHTAKSSGIAYFEKLDEATVVRFDPLNYRKYILGRLFKDIHNEVENYVKTRLERR